MCVDRVKIRLRTAVVCSLDTGPCADYVHISSYFRVPCAMSAHLPPHNSDSDFINFGIVVRLLARKQVTCTNVGRVHVRCACAASACFVRPQLISQHPTTIPAALRQLWLFLLIMGRARPVGIKTRNTRALANRSA